VVQGRRAQRRWRRRVELSGDNPAVAFTDLSAEIATEVRLLHAVGSDQPMRYLVIRQPMMVQPLQTLAAPIGVISREFLSAWIGHGSRGTSRPHIGSGVRYPRGQS
jgi:hypothetical protein